MNTVGPEQAGGIDTGGRGHRQRGAGIEMQRGATGTQRETAGSNGKPQEATGSHWKPPRRNGEQRQAAGNDGEPTQGKGTQAGGRASDPEDFASSRHPRMEATSARGHMQLRIARTNETKRIPLFGRLSNDEPPLTHTTSDICSVPIRPPCGWRLGGGFCLCNFRAGP